MELLAEWSVEQWLAFLGGVIILTERAYDRIKSSERNTAAIKQRDATEAKIDRADEKIGQVGKVADATHTLVNSNMGTALRSSASALRRYADLTHDEKDIALALAAETLLAEHEAKQKMVDQGRTTPL